MSSEISDTLSPPSPRFSVCRVSAVWPVPALCLVPANCDPGTSAEVTPGGLFTENHLAPWVVFLGMRRAGAQPAWPRHAELPGQDCRQHHVAIAPVVLCCEIVMPCSARPGSAVHGCCAAGAARRAELLQRDHLQHLGLEVQLRRATPACARLHDAQALVCTATCLNSDPHTPPLLCMFIYNGGRGGGNDLALCINNCAKPPRACISAPHCQTVLLLLGNLTVTRMSLDMPMAACQDSDPSGGIVGADGACFSHAGMCGERRGLCQ